MSEHKQKEPRTEGGSVTVGLPGMEFEDAQRDLVALRVSHGADTPIGHRCSNLIGQIEAYANCADLAQEASLKNLIAKGAAELAELTK